MLRENFIALNAYIRKEEQYQIHNLILARKNLEKEKEKRKKASGRKYGRK